MSLREKLTFYEPFRPLFGSLFVVERSVRKTFSFLNRSESWARKTYVLRTTQLNHIIPLNVVARETYVLETIFRPRFEKLKVFLNRLRGAKCRRAKNSRFSNHLFCQIWCGTKNSRFLNRFFPWKWCGTKNLRFLNHFVLPNGAARKTHVFWTIFYCAKWRGTENSRFSNRFFLCQMMRHEKLMFF